MSNTAENLFNRGAILRLEIRKPGGQKTIKGLGAEAAEADAERVKGVVKLIDSNELETIVSIDAAARARIASYALKSPLKAGTYFIPATLIERAELFLAEYRETRAAAIDAYIAVYGDAVEESRRKLGTLYNPADYESAESVRARFSVSHSWLSFAPAQVLRQLNEELYAAEAAKHAEQLQSAADEIRDSLRATALELVSNLAERLRIGSNGKPQVFRDSLVENLREFLSLFPDLNIGNDSDLARIIDRARGLTAHNPQTLRGDLTAREDIRQQAEAIKAAIGDLRTADATRRIHFDE